MKIAIRLDDISPDMDMERFDRLVSLMDRYGVKPLLSIIPDNRDPAVACGEKDPAFWDRLLQMQENGYVLAMHGCYHVYTTDRGGIFPLNRLSEFAGHSYEEQSRLVGCGQETLRAHCIETRIFVAPAHSFDNTTLRVLKEHGFDTISDGYGKGPFTAAGFRWIPISFDRRRSLSGRDGEAVLVIHPATMNDRDFAEYEQIFSDHVMIPFGDLLEEEAPPKGLPRLLGQRLMALTKRLLGQGLKALALQRR